MEVELTISVEMKTAGKPAQWHILDESNLASPLSTDFHNKQPYGPTTGT